MNNAAKQAKKEENKKFRQIALNELVNGRIVYLMAFLVPLIIMIAIYAARGIYPFGQVCYLRSDMYHQYCPFFTELWDKLRSGESLAYTWDIGLGTNFLAIFGYYLSSPTNWFIALFPQKYMIEMMNVIILLKTSTASLTCTYFLCKRNNKIHLSAAAFGIFYGLSGYIAAFSWNLMWLDCVLLLPLIFHGIDMLVRKGKGLMYAITLGLAILSNYYIAIMVCISCVIYFLVSAVSMPVQKDGMPYVKALLNFILYSLLAGGLAAILLLPEIYALEYTASSDINFPDTLTRYFSFVTVFQRHLINIEVSTGLDHMPNIYCGVAVFLLTPIYMVCSKIPLRERIMKVLALIVFYTAFNLNIPNFIWHGFHYPNSLPCRQSFIYIFLIITIGYDVVRNIKHLSNTQLGMGLWASLIFLLFLGHTLDEDVINFDVLYISAFFIALYAFAMYLYMHKKVNRSILSILVFALAITECTINMEHTGCSTTSRTYYFKDYTAINTLLEDLEEEDDSFYRITKFSGFRSKNDAAWHDFNSASIFSSTAYKGITDLYDRLGLEHSMNAYAINGATPLVYSMFNVKYMLSDNDMVINPLISLRDIYDDENITEYLYENKYTLPPAYMVPSDFDGNWVFEENANPFEVQNAFAESAAGITDLFTPVEFYDNYSSVTFTTEKDQYIFVHSQNTSIDNLSIRTGEVSNNFPAIKHGRTADLGYVSAGTEIYVTDSENNSSLQLLVYTMDIDKFIQLYDSLADEGLKVTDYDDNHIEGTITVNEDGLCLTSIPYDESFTLYVDGVKTDFTEAADSLIAFKLTKGTHTIKLDYTPRGVVTGGIISGICLLIIIGCIIFNIKFKKEISEEGSIDAFVKSLSRKKSNENEAADENSDKNTVEAAETGSEITDRKDESI